MFSRDEILDSIADDIGTGFRSHVQFVHKVTGKLDGITVLHRTGRGGIDHTPPWRTRGRATNERKKLNKVTRSLFAIALEIEASR